MERRLIQAAAGGETAAQFRRNEVKNERGICRIQKRIPDSPGARQGETTVGCGTLVKLAEDQIPNQWRFPGGRSFKYAIITAENVFQAQNFDLKDYFLDFKKSDREFKTFELDRVVKDRPFPDPAASGVTVIPLDSHASVFRHGLFKKKCSVLRHGAFDVDLVYDYSEEFCCHMVAEESSSNRSFGVKTHKLTRDTSERYQLDNFTSSILVPLGCAILRKAERKWSLVGVQLNAMTSDPQTFQPRPVWLSSLFLAEAVDSGGHRPREQCTTPSSGVPPVAQPPITTAGSGVPPVALPPITTVGSGVPPVALPPITTAGSEVPPVAQQPSTTAGSGVPPVAQPPITTVGSGVAQPPITTVGSGIPPVAQPPITTAGNEVPPAAQQPSTTAGSGVAQPPSTTAGGGIPPVALPPITTVGSGVPPAAQQPSTTAGSGVAQPPSTTAGSGIPPVAQPNSTTSGSGVAPVVQPPITTAGSGVPPVAQPNSTTSGSGVAPVAQPPITTAGSGVPPVAQPSITTAGSGIPPAAQPPSTTAGGGVAQPPSTTAGGGVPPVAQPPITTAGGGIPPVAQPHSTTAGSGVTQPPSTTAGSGVTQPPRTTAGSGVTQPPSTTAGSEVPPVALPPITTAGVGIPPVAQPPITTVGSGIPPVAQPPSTTAGSEVPPVAQPHSTTAGSEVPPLITTTRYAVSPLPSTTFSNVASPVAQLPNTTEAGVTPSTTGHCIGDVVANHALVDELARCLDKEYRVLKYWKHMADNLEIPPKIQKGFEVYFELSPTVHLFPFLSTLRGRDPLTIGKLKTALQDIHRNDLKNKFQGVSDTAMVDDVFNRNPSLLDSIAVELDSAKRPLGCWRDLASILIADGQLLREFEAELHYPFGNPTALLFSYLSKAKDFRYLKICQLKEKLNHMPRRDVVMLLVDANVQDDYLLTDVLCPDSDLLNSISTLLNKKSPGVKNWKILAYKLGVPNEVYDEFEENLPKKSPTKMMLKWLNSERPGLTVEQLRTALKEIGRADALEILDGYLSQQDIERAANHRERIASYTGVHHEQRPTTKDQSLQTANGELHSRKETSKISPNHSPPESRLSMTISQIPLRVYSQICMKLNIRRLSFDDYRMLGEKLGLLTDEITVLGQQENPTHGILTKWSSTGTDTVDKLIGVLGEEGFERNDVIMLLEQWVNGKG